MAINAFKLKHSCSYFNHVYVHTETPLKYVQISEQVFILNLIKGLT